MLLEALKDEECSRYWTPILWEAKVFTMCDVCICKESMDSRLNEKPIHTTKNYLMSLCVQALF